MGKILTVQTQGPPLTMCKLGIVGNVYTLVLGKKVTCESQALLEIQSRGKSRLQVL